MRKSVAFLMQADALTMQADALTMQADALTMQADALTMQADALTMQANALTMSSIANLIRYELMKCCTKLLFAYLTAGWHPHPIRFEVF